MNQPKTPYQRFLEHAQLDFEGWHDGTSHDLQAIREASRDEKTQIENWLIARGLQHPRDIEALALIGTPRSRTILKAALDRSSNEVRAAIVRLLPDLMTEKVKVQAMVELIAQTDAFDGLSAVLDQIQTFHPAPIIDAMLRRIAQGPSVAAVHFAAMLYFVHGLSQEPFDWDYRPFFLQFSSDNESVRRAALSELCRKLNMAPCDYL